jgi:hypothetical protein
LVASNQLPERFVETLLGEPDQLIVRQSREFFRHVLHLRSEGVVQ